MRPNRSPEHQRPGHVNIPPNAEVRRVAIMAVRDSRPPQLVMDTFTAKVEENMGKLARHTIANVHEKGGDDLLTAGVKILLDLPADMPLKETQEHLSKLTPEEAQYLYHAVVTNTLSELFSCYMGFFANGFNLPDHSAVDIGVMGLEQAVRVADHFTIFAAQACHAFAQKEAAPNN